MIRFYFLIVIIGMGPLAFSQAWQDSLRVGQDLYNQGDYEAAYHSIVAAQKLAPSEVDLSQDIGNAAYRSGNFEMAEKAFKSSATKSLEVETEAKRWHNVGNSQMKAKDYKAAIESYKNSLRLDPGSKETRYNLAEAQRRVKVQQEQQQSKSNQQKEDADKNPQDNSDKNSPEAQNDQEDQPKDGEEDNQPNQGTSGEDNPQDREGDTEGKLSDRKSDRVLDDLLKKEIETKKKVRRMEDLEKGKPIKSGKRW